MKKSGSGQVHTRTTQEGSTCEDRNGAAVRAEVVPRTECLVTRSVISDDIGLADLAIGHPALRGQGDRFGGG